MQKRDKILIAAAVAMPFVFLILDGFSVGLNKITPDPLMHWVHEERYRGLFFYLIVNYGLSAALIFFAHIKMWKKALFITAIFVIETPMLMVAGVMWSCSFKHVCL